MLFFESCFLLMRADPNSPGIRCSGVVISVSDHQPYYSASQSLRPHPTNFLVLAELECGLFDAKEKAVLNWKLCG